MGRQLSSPLRYRCCGDPARVAAGVYLEEYGKKNWLTDIIEINIATSQGFRRSFTASLPRCSSTP